MDNREGKRAILFKGVFWVIDGQIISKKVACDEYGDMVFQEGNSKDFQAEAWINNHKKIWSKWPRSITLGKPYNYYPRGRVEIRNKKAIIFLNPSICTKELTEMIKKEFCLKANNILQEIQVKADGSWHYKCYCNE